MQYLPGWTVQCLNAQCSARGQWLRVETPSQEACSSCGAPLQNVPPPLGPRLRMPRVRWPVTVPWAVAARALPNSLFFLDGMIFVCPGLLLDKNLNCRWPDLLAL